MSVQPVPQRKATLYRITDHDAWRGENRAERHVATAPPIRRIDRVRTAHPTDQGRLFTHLPDSAIGSPLPFLLLPCTITATLVKAKARRSDHWRE